MKLVDGIALLLPFSPGYLLAVASLEDSLIQEPFNIDIEEEKRSLSFLRYTCEKSDGTVDQLTGYRCSPYPKDKGYKYVYDVLTGIIFDTSLYKSIKSDVTDIYRFDDLMEWYKTEEFKECKKKGMVDKNGQLITEESIGIHYNEITRIDISLSYYNCVKLYYGESFKEFEDFDIQNIVYIIQQCNGLKKLFYFDWEVKDYFVHSMLQSVPNPENLIGLHIIGHRFSEEFINLEDINRFKNLEQLSLQSVNITDISELNLDNFPNLRGLDVSNNHIVDISKISSPSLKSLKLDNNELTKLSDLENLPKLTILSVDDNFISDISELKSSSVVVIDISNNKLTEFVSLENLPDLLILDVTGNYLTDTSYIKDYYIEKLKNTKFKFDFTDDGQKSQYDNPKIYQKK